MSKIEILSGIDDDTNFGLVASGKRNIRSGKEFDHLYPKADMNQKVAKRDGSVFDTLKLMEKIVKDYSWQTDKIAPHLKGKSLRETILNVWTYVYNHYQYHLDREGVEELRTPARAWADRVTGIDCDCMSITVACILKSIGIQANFRITKYSGNWQHVYVYVLTEDKKRQYIIDCVLDTPFYEKPYSQKHDHTMKGFDDNSDVLLGIPVEILTGLNNTEGCPGHYLGDIITGADFNNLDDMGLAGNEAEAFMQATYNHLVKTRDYIKANAGTLKVVGNAQAHYDMFNYAISKWNTPERDAALEILAEQEEEWNRQNGLSAPDDDDLGADDFDNLGRTKTGKKFFKKLKETVKEVKKTVSNTANKVVDKGGDLVKKVGQTAGKGIKKLGKALVKYNPVTLAMRGGLLLAFRTNLFRMAQKAKASPRAYDKVKKFFVDKMQGQESKLKQAIEAGAKGGEKRQAKKGMKGLGSLGVATAAAMITAAVPIMTALSKINSESKNIMNGIHGPYDEERVFAWIDTNSFIVSGFGSAFGDDTDPEEAEANKVAAELKEGEDEKSAKAKGVIGKFIELMKKWVGKKKNDPTQQELEKAAIEANNADPSQGGSEEVDEGAGDGSGDGDGEGFVSKIKSFVVENPVKATIGAAVVLGLGVMLLKPKKSSLSGTRKRRTSTRGLAGHSAKKALAAKTKSKKPAHKKHKVLKLKK